jgi:hypothetical protein
MYIHLISSLVYQGKYVYLASSLGRIHIPDISLGRMYTTDKNWPKYIGEYIHLAKSLRTTRLGEYVHLISALRRIHITDQNTRENTYTWPVHKGEECEGNTVCIVYCTLPVQKPGNLSGLDVKAIFTKNGMRLWPLPRINKEFDLQGKPN